MSGGWTIFHGAMIWVPRSQITERPWAQSGPTCCPSPTPSTPRSSASDATASSTLLRCGCRPQASSGLEERTSAACQVLVNACLFLHRRRLSSPWLWSTRAASSWARATQCPLCFIPAALALAALAPAPSCGGGSSSGRSWPWRMCRATCAAMARAPRSSRRCSPLLRRTPPCSTSPSPTSPASATGGSRRAGTAVPVVRPARCSCARPAPAPALAGWSLRQSREALWWPSRSRKERERERGLVPGAE